MRTRKNVLIEINPHTRIPRTFARFCGLIGQRTVAPRRAALTAAARARAVQLLDELKIRSADGSEVLMRVIKNPVTNYLPAGACVSICIAFALMID